MSSSWFTVLMDLVSDLHVFLNTWGVHLFVSLITSQLASLPMIHVLASVDHIRGNLLLPSGSLASFNFVFVDATTFEPYFYEKMFMSQVSQAYRYSYKLLSILVVNRLQELRTFSVHSQGITWRYCNYYPKKLMVIMRESHFQTFTSCVFVKCWSAVRNHSNLS